MVSWLEALALEPNCLGLNPLRLVGLWPCRSLLTFLCPRVLLHMDNKDDTGNHSWVWCERHWEVANNLIITVAIIILLYLYIACVYVCIF